MCGGVQFTHDSREWKVYFPNPKAVLPVRPANGELELIPWGRRREEPGTTPKGGWAREDSLKKGLWEKYFPRYVVIEVSAFMEKDTHRYSHWYPLVKGQGIQGIVVKDGQLNRVYVVTIAPEDDAHREIHDRWPLIVQLP